MDLLGKGWPLIVILVIAFVLLVIFVSFLLTQRRAHREEQERALSLLNQEQQEAYRRGIDEMKARHVTVALLEDDSDSMMGAMIANFLIGEGVPTSLFTEGKSAKLAQGHGGIIPKDSYALVGEVQRSKGQSFEGEDLYIYTVRLLEETSRGLKERVALEQRSLPVGDDEQAFAAEMVRDLAIYLSNYISPRSAQVIPISAH